MSGREYELAILKSIDENKKTQQDIKRNSYLILGVTVVGFFIYIGLYIFFIIIPLRRVEVKAEDTIASIKQTSEDIDKVAKDVDSILEEVISLKNTVENKFEKIEDELCSSEFCDLFSGSTKEFCEAATFAICPQSTSSSNSNSSNISTLDTTSTTSSSFNSPQIRNRMTQLKRNLDKFNDNIDGL